MGCESDKKNLGVGKCTDLPTLIRGIITTPPEFKATAANLVLQTFLQNAIADDANSRIYLWPKFSTVPENRSTETIYEDNPVSFSHILDGRYRWLAHISKSLCFHKAAFSHRSSTDRVWLIDGKNNLIGTYVGDDINGDAEYAGFTLDLLNVENLMFSDGSVSTKTPILIALADPMEFNDPVYGAYMFKVPFLNLLAPLTDVEIVVTAQVAGKITVTVKTKCDQSPVTGLVEADFSVTTTVGAAQTIDTVTETEDGTYEITHATAFVDGFVDIVGPQALSVYPTLALESLGKATVDIP
jgi:hypothetical protein